ncbi:large ribosomal subunit protein bL21m [Periplaneta americana]|uniref:large ribosomal subunit protein bL21m n=1 Tax=Periplaneta americana TaxID=6978 RepID=UPI0037E7316C
MSLILNKFLIPLFSVNKLQVIECASKCISLCGYNSNGATSLWSQTISSLHSLPETQKIIPETSDVTKEKEKSKEVISKVNKLLEEGREGRLFAVVHISGKQFKVTTEDIITVEGYWAPQIGDKIKLEKVLLAGGSDFTLLGRPILSTDLVSVHATVIEKTLSHIKTVFKKKRRKQYQRINFHRTPYTMLRINSIHIKPEVNVKKDVEGIDGKIF